MMWKPTVPSPRRVKTRKNTTARSLRFFKSAPGQHRQHAGIRHDFPSAITDEGRVYNIHPPLTFKTCPVTNDASSEAKNFTAAATSWAVAGRPTGKRAS